jgi:UDP-2,3-diacylglucosamine hydrolase
LPSAVRDRISLISDLHLDPTRPDLDALFFAWLAEHGARSRAVYILGDLFESWIGDDDESAWITSIAAALADVRDRGTELFFQAGNRDFLLGRAFASRCGMQLLAEEVVVDFYGHRYLLVHGDQLCTDDETYQVFRQQTRSSDWQASFLQQPLSARKQFAEQARLASKRHQREIGQSFITDVNQNALIGLMRKHAVARLLHGHTHRPAIHPLSEGERLVLGDWGPVPSWIDISPTALVLHARGERHRLEN